MLRTELIDLVNSGTTWAFVGSGVSADAGYPTWRQLVEGTLRLTPEANREKARNDGRFKKAFQQGRYETCLSVIEKHAGRDHLERAVAAQLAAERRSGRIAAIVTEWPFAGYVTSNFDMLLESILAGVPNSSWTSVGNTASEIRKVSGDARELVWHVHGGIGLGKDESHLTLTEEDYDDIYLEGSPLVQQLRALLTQRRLVFIGFGFNDPELRRLLKVVAKYTSPTQPVFAFLSEIPSSDEETRRLELLEGFNVDVIPYQVVDGSYAALTDLLNTYSAFVLRRSLQFGQPRRRCPSYDPETTGLLVYNQLALTRGSPVTEDAVGSLVRARVLALLRHGGPCTIDELTEDLWERTRQLKEASLPSAPVQADETAAASTLSKAIGDLEDLRLVERVDGGLGPGVQLTQEGDRLTEDQAAAARLMAQQFSASLEVRAQSAAPHLEPEAQRRIASVAQAFLEECASKRALGVAMAWYSSAIDFKAYHIVALLQALPDYAQQLSSADEGKTLIDIIRSILARPNDTEVKYIGSLVQARFGLCLMGFDPETLAARTRELSKTVFLLDSTTLIPLVGRSSRGYSAAKHLLAQIERVGATAATTDLLAVEVAEHARWAQKELGQSRALTSVQALGAATGRAGAGDNVFIEGCVAEAEGGGPLDFDRYLDSICGVAAGHQASDWVFQDAMRRNGIECLAFPEWEGFAPELWSPRDSMQAEIAERRRASHTYRHERQVQAEAEALLIVQHLRNGTFGLGDQTFADAYFLSHSRVIDEVSRPTRPITMRPQAAQQWLSTLTACAPDELAFIVNGILWELSERGMSIVDEGRIRTVFSPLIDASKSKLEEEVARHRDLIAERYGEHATNAFAEVSPLDAPFVAESYFARKSRELEAVLLEREEALEKALRQGALSAKERQELEELRAKSKLKKLETKRQRRKRAGRARRRSKRRKR